MSQISYKALEKYLDTINNNRQAERFSPVYLISGDPWLCKNAFELLLNAMLPESERTNGYEPIDGANEKIADAVERVNTYSFFSGTKVVAVHDSQVFDSKQDKNKILEKAKTAWDSNEPAKASKYLANLLSLLSLSFDDIRGTGQHLLTQDTGHSASDDQWLEKLVRYCTDSGMSVSAGKDHAGILEAAIKKGFPKGNHLVIIAENADKRRSLFKAIDQNGVIIDCSVPQGNRRADKIAQEAVLNERIKPVLEQYGKAMDKQAYNALYDMTGFDPRTFFNNLEKLVLYIKDRELITVDDVHAVIKQTRKSPVFELTGAVLDRNLDTALDCLNSLLRDAVYPLQILAAIINQIRKLLLVKSFTASQHGQSWHDGMSYSQFQSCVMPEIKKFDAALNEHWEHWADALNKSGEAETEGAVKPRVKKKSRPSADLFVVQNPNNPYPVYQIVSKSGHYTTEELFAIMLKLGKADVKLKTTGQNPKLILEEVIFELCGKMKA